MLIDKEKILEQIKKRPGIELVDVDSLYEDAVQDVLDFTHRDRAELTEAMGSVIKDLIAFRFNTLGVEGVTAESNGGVNTHYEQDIPPRIKAKLRSFRRLNYVRQQSNERG